MKIFDVLNLSVYGQSHSEEIGMVLSGLPHGATVDAEELRRFTERRKSGKYLFSTPRREDDAAVWDFGVTESDNGKLLLDSSVKAHINNTNVRKADYGYARTPRPSHADYVSVVKDGDNAAASGGGRFSGRMTAPLVVAGGIAVQLLAQKGVNVGAYIGELAGVKGKSYLDGNVPSSDEIALAHDAALPMLSGVEEAEKVLSETARRGDSAGGIVECVVTGLPVGLGDAMTEGLESKLSAMLFGIPGAKGVEFGAGFSISSMTGSRANDPFVIRNGKVATSTNNAGGINGGITNGMPVTMRVAFRPTPSVSLPQRTVDLDTMTETEITVHGRHDVCFVPRAVAAVESAVALVILDEMLKTENNGAVAHLT